MLTTLAAVGQAADHVGAVRDGLVGRRHQRPVANRARGQGGGDLVGRLHRRQRIESGADRSCARYFRARRGRSATAGRRSPVVDDLVAEPFAPASPRALSAPGRVSQPQRELVADPNQRQPPHEVGVVAELREWPISERISSAVCTKVDVGGERQHVAQGGRPRVRSALTANTKMR